MLNKHFSEIVKLSAGWLADLCFANKTAPRILCKRPWNFVDTTICCITAVVWGILLFRPVGECAGAAAGGPQRLPDCQGCPEDRQVDIRYVWNMKWKASPRLCLYPCLMRLQVAVPWSRPMTPPIKESKQSLCPSCPVLWRYCVGIWPNILSTPSRTNYFFFILSIIFMK